MSTLRNSVNVVNGKMNVLAYIHVASMVVAFSGAPEKILPHMFQR